MTFDTSSLSDAYLVDEEIIVNELLSLADPGPAQRQDIKQLATQLVNKVRENIDELDGIDAFMQEYDLSSKEGILLMCLAEALLRIPDKSTADKLIKDKILDADWKSHLGKSDSLFVNASTWGLMLTGRIIDIDVSKKGMSKAMDKFINKTGEPVIRTGLLRAMEMMGKQFVMGRTIKEALNRGKKKGFKKYRFSYDMLGEAALTQEDADRYYQSYEDAIHAIAEANKKRHINDASSISIKLSALHPRYELANTERVMSELAPRVLSLVQQAKNHNVAVTIDAEEADRLELSLKVFADVYRQLEDYEGFGLVVQAYQKRALDVLKLLISLVQEGGRLIPLRLVKGAYWDTEIKLAQEQGLSHYPVYTRKANTDLAYLACARLLLANRDKFYPQFATHNANTVAAIYTMAGDQGGYEFQRLHGMGQPLHNQTIAEDGLNRPCRVYAPVGSHQDLLPYLVRRLLENGANTSFVNRLTDLKYSIDVITQDPIERVAKNTVHKHPQLPLPQDIFSENRLNSAGVNVHDSTTLQQLQSAIEAQHDSSRTACSVINGQSKPGAENFTVHSPADLNKTIGHYSHTDEAGLKEAVDTAHNYFPQWRDSRSEDRCEAARKTAELLETNRDQLLYLLRHEAGKTLEDAIAELREAVDFCRYYAEQAGQLCGDPMTMPGPTGESNFLYHQGKGVFVCISPWNFPLAIFTGQIIAALVTGNCVIAKPAEQTNLIAHKTVQLMHQAGFPPEALQLTLGPGKLVGNYLCRHPAVHGVVFTGSTATAQVINRNLVNRDSREIATLIAETGGQNCMIADSSTLPEQLVEDVIDSAFYSCGQRCSALRVLYIQDDVADKVITMLQGAMNQLKVGHPRHFDTDVGPLIDQTALDTLLAHRDKMAKTGQLLKAPKLPDLKGYYVSPQAVEIDSIRQLDEEIFGPFLHIIRYPSKNLDQVIEDINSTGYGLTTGVHSRIDDTIEYVVSKVQAGNCYINRNMTGAVVGVHPFGGMGLSGTGPKAGGPGYLHRFVHEKTVTNNIAAVGGNADILGLSDD